jgi:hypothetical protein
MKFAKLTMMAGLIVLFLASAGWARSWNTIAVQKVPDVKLNQTLTLTIDLNRGGFEFASFRLSLYYNPLALTLTGAYLGEIFTECNWEYFNYAVAPCPDSGFNLVNIEAIAEYYDNGNTATCHEGPGTIATLQFQTGSDTSLQCKPSPVGFYWEDCLSNVVICPTGDTLYLSDYVVDFGGKNITDLPSFGGAPDYCMGEFHDSVPYRFIDYYAGGPIFKCPSQFLCGDINGDDKINLLDPVYLTDYLFRSGPAPDPIERGNVNCSGVLPDLADLVYIVSYIFNLGPEPCCE